MPKVFGKKRARREGFSRQQRHPLGLRVGTIPLPTPHSPRRRAQLELGLRRLLPRRGTHLLQALIQSTTSIFSVHRRVPRGSPGLEPAAW